MAAFALWPGGRLRVFHRAGVFMLRMIHAGMVLVLVHGLLRHRRRRRWFFAWRASPGKQHDGKRSGQPG